MEPQVLAEIADRYRREGYDVVVTPGPGQIPDFLAGFRPDLLATRGEQGVVVEVKLRRLDLADDPQITRLAEVLDARPGWRLDTIVLEPETSLEGAAQGGVEPSDSELQQMLDTADELAANGYAPYACVVAWAGLEAAMRRLRDEVELYGRSTPNELMTTLYGKGFLSREQFLRLRHAQQIRNRIVHGLVPQTVDTGTVRYLTDTVRNLVEGGQVTTATG